jgi:hypothetical protein
VCEKQDLSLGRKVMKPCSELNPRVWQGDCFVGIDQKRSEMFQSWKAGGPLLGTDSVHYPDDIAARRLPTTPGSRRRRASVVRQKFLNMIFGVNGPSQF